MRVWVGEGEWGEVSLAWFVGVFVWRDGVVSLPYMPPPPCVVLCSGGRFTVHSQHHSDSQFLLNSGISSGIQSSQRFVLSGVFISNVFALSLSLSLSLITERKLCPTEFVSPRAIRIEKISCLTLSHVLFHFLLLWKLFLSLFVSIQMFTFLPENADILIQCFFASSHLCV